MKNTKPFGAHAKLMTEITTRVLERLTIGLVPKCPTMRFATNSGSNEPIPDSPIINPQTANETPIWSINSGILGMYVIATKPWVKKNTKSAVCALFSLAGAKGMFLLLLCNSEEILALNKLDAFTLL